MEEGLPAIWNRAALLDRLENDEEIVEMIIDGVLEDVPRQIETLKSYLKAADVAGTVRQAHSIKGAAANVGAERLRILAFELEKAGRAGDLKGIKVRIGDLTAAFEQFRQKTI